jgi:hypothetical protein
MSQLENFLVFHFIFTTKQFELKLLDYACFPFAAFNGQNKLASTFYALHFTGDFIKKKRGPIWFL